MTFSNPIRSIVVCALLMFVPAARADLLNLLLGKPDIASFLITVHYDHNSDLFTANGFAAQYDDGVTVPAPEFLGGFDLSASIDDSGHASSGSLNITGDVNGFGPSLLTGNLSDFGFLDPPGSKLFEFKFNITGGDLATAMGGLGSPVGVILDANTVFDGHWDHDFSNGDSGNADTAPTVPSPSSGSLALLGGLIACALRKSNRDLGLCLQRI